LICKQIGYDFNRIQFDTTKYVGAKSKCLNTDKLNSLLPNLKLTSLEIGLSNTIDWFWSEQGKLFPEAKSRGDRDARLGIKSYSKY
jgi:GDP-L-fucose synthase